jgi:hypothetical protein
MCCQTSDGLEVERTMLLMCRLGTVAECVQLWRTHRGSLAKHALGRPLAPPLPLRAGSQRCMGTKGGWRVFGVIRLRSFSSFILASASDMKKPMPPIAARMPTASDGRTTT